jgi:chemotaxis protein CheX
METTLVDEGDVTMIVESIFAELLGFGVLPAPVPSSPAGDQLAGLVRISGEWHGTVTVTCDQELAGRIATAMLDRAPASPAEVADAVGEVANMTGGNVKALLPGPSVLSLPEVAGGAAAAPPPGRVVTRLAFAIDSSPLVVTVVEDPDHPGGAVD